MTLPSVDTLSIFGGALQDYQIAVVDPTTERAASAANQAYADIAMMTHMVPRARVSWTGINATHPVVTSHDALWGSDLLNIPVLTRTGLGVYTITWPGIILDELGVSHSVNLLTGWVNMGSTTAYIANLSGFADGNVATVYLFDAAGSATDAVGAKITVWAI